MTAETEVSSNKIQASGDPALLMASESASNITGLKPGMDPRKNARVMKYGDKTSLVSLWYKVLLLLPPWAIPIAAIIGFFSYRIGGLSVEIGYGAIVALGTINFIEEVLKRKIKLDKGNLYFGFKKFKLSDLRALRVEYGSERIVPEKLVFHFSGDRTLSLKLGRFQSDDVGFLIKEIDTYYPHASIDPVLKTLDRCREINPRHKKGDGPVALVYNTNRDWAESKAAFMTNLSAWTRLGPLVVWLLAAPIWLSFSGFVYQVSKVSGLGKTISIQTLLSNASLKINYILGLAFKNVGESAIALISNPIVAIVGFVAVLWIVFNLVKKLGQPTLLVLDKEELRLYQAFRGIKYQIESIRWAAIRRVGLYKPRPESPPENWRIRMFSEENKQLLSLEFAALSQKGRAEIYEHLKAYSKGSTISPELAEMMLPKQQGSYTELWLQSLSGSPNRENLDPLDAGSLLQEGRYEVLNKLGIGGQGAAYLANENSLIEREHCPQVVLKETIFPLFVDSSVRRQSLERFEHEARTLEILDHEKVVKLIDFFVEDHRGYLVLEHIEGQNLRDATRGNPMSEKTAIKLAMEMCDVLEYLHSKNVLHRDFTPDNLILEKGGSIKLIDFNVAQTHNSGMTGTVVGKHAYVPPEQFRGKPTTRSDIYAMGCTLYHLLIGKDPQPITTSDVSSERPDVSTEFATIIKRCTALKEEHRFQDINELREALRLLDETGMQAGDATIDLSHAKRGETAIIAGGMNPQTTKRPESEEV